MLDERRRFGQSIPPSPFFASISPGSIDSKTDAWKALQLTASKRAPFEVW